MRNLLLAAVVCLSICVCQSSVYGQAQTSPQHPVAAQPPAPALQPNVQSPGPVVFQIQPQVPVATTAAGATNLAILQQYGVAQQPMSVAVAGTPVVVQAAAAGVSASSTRSGSITVGPGLISQWLIQRFGKQHTWTWTHTVTPIAPVAPVTTVVPATPTSFVATTAFAVPAAVSQPAPQQFQLVAVPAPAPAPQPSTVIVVPQPVAPPKRDEDAPPPPARPTPQTTVAKHGLFGRSVN